VALLRQGAAKVRDDEQKSSQAYIVGRACNTRQSPLSIIGNVRILGIHAPKDVCLPREVCHVPFEKSRATEFWLSAGQPALTVWQKSAEGIVAGANEMARVTCGSIASSDSPR
jgi:hypothetical protein